MSEGDRTITLVVNGTPRSVAAGSSVEHLVALVASSPKGIAVAVNADVVPRSLWAETAVADGDQVEVLTAAQGG